MKQQKGFGIAGVIGLVAIVVILSFAGWRVFDANKKPADQATQEPAPVNEDGRPTVQLYEDTENGISFRYPLDWSIDNEHSRGVQFRSNDFASEVNFRKISAGSALHFYWEERQDVPTDLDAWLQREAGNAAQIKDIGAFNFVSAGGTKAIRFSHSAGENQNTHLVVVFYKNQRKYIIDQQYKMNAANPYPEFMNLVLTSLKITN